MTKSLYFSNWQATRLIQITELEDSRIIKVGKDIKSSSVQFPAQGRVSFEFRPGCSGLYPFRC